MRDIVTANGKGFDQVSGRAGNANGPPGRTTANQELHMDTNNAPHTFLEGLSEDAVRLRRAHGQGNTVKLPTTRSCWCSSLLPRAFGLEAMPQAGIGDRQFWLRLGGLTVLLSVPLGRAFFEIGAVTLLDAAAIVGIALLCAFLLHFVWRFRLLEHVLGMESEEGPSSHAI